MTACVPASPRRRRGGNVVVEALALVCLVAVLCGASWWLGHAAGASELADARAASAAAVQAAQRDGAAAAADLTAQLDALRAHATTLQQRIDHAPLLAPAARPRCTAGTAAAPGAAVALGARPADPAAAAGLAAAPAAAPPDAGAADGDAGDDDQQLSLAAVRLWDAALTGADVSGAACSSADPTQPACAAGSGLDIRDAWLNHARNATACAADRARLAHLIDLLRRWPGQQPQP